MLQAKGSIGCIFCLLSSKPIDNDWANISMGEVLDSLCQELTKN